MGYIPSFLPLEIITIADDKSIGLNTYSNTDGATGRTGNPTQPTNTSIDANVVLGTNDPRAGLGGSTAMNSILQSATQNITQPTATYTPPAPTPTTPTSPSVSTSAQSSGVGAATAPATTAPNAGNTSANPTPPTPPAQQPTSPQPPASNTTPPPSSGTANLCPAVYNPVITSDGSIFSNDCTARMAGYTDFQPYVEGNGTTNGGTTNGTSDSTKFDIKSFTQKNWPILLLLGLVVLYSAKNKS